MDLHATLSKFGDFVERSDGIQECRELGAGLEWRDLQEWALTECCDCVVREPTGSKSVLAVVNPQDSEEVCVDERSGGGR